jgi:hypothetical protein
MVKKIKRFVPQLLLFRAKKFKNLIHPDKIVLDGKKVLFGFTSYG